ncbi:DUF6090 family protein [Croceiramulus getboli]|nr:DUF6090 family protein [Flavobacteriaceae bacterium YJPT1-3]
MIQFFRKIRQRLLVENKFSKYLLYAIGEIVLVVIGILIALQINTWNEQRKNRIEEIAILQSLRDNLKLSQKQSESLVAQERNSREVMLQVLGLQAETSPTFKDTLSDKLFKDAFWNVESDIPVINAYTDLKNTNKLGVIQNQKIKERFTGLEVNLNELKGMLEDRLNVQQIRIDAIAEHEINFVPLIQSSIPSISMAREQPNDYAQILINPRIRNLLGMKLNLTQDVLNYRVNLDQEIKALLQLIEKELASSS